MEQVLPFVTTMIVVRNEETYIGKAVLSLLKQDYPKDRMELLIIDGMSEDQTVEQAQKAVEEYEREQPKVSVKYLKNEKRNLAAGWNLGIREARGEFVVRIDAHAQADLHLLSKGVQTLCANQEIACAGGRLETEALTEKGRLIADVLSSPFGVGNAKFRYSEVSGYVDTVAYGVYRKEIFDKAGYFNEEFQRNQDNDMHGRIKKCGGKFYLDTSIKNLYHSRENVKGMMKQAFGNGRWTMIGLGKSESREGISVRHLVPFLFVIGQIVLLIGSLFFRIARYMLAFIYILYGGLAICFARKKTRNVSKIFRMLCLYWLFHISYGAGSLMGLSFIKNSDSKKALKG